MKIGSVSVNASEHTIADLHLGSPTKNREKAQNPESGFAGDERS